MLKALGYLLASLFGFVLGCTNFGLGSVYLWLLLGIFMAYGVVERLRGREDICKNQSE